MPAELSDRERVALSLRGYPRRERPPRAVALEVQRAQNLHGAYARRERRAWWCRITAVCAIVCAGCGAIYLCLTWLNP